MPLKQCDIIQTYSMVALILSIFSTMSTVL